MKEFISKIKNGLCWILDNSIFNVYLMLIGSFVMLEGVIEPLISSDKLWYIIAGILISFIIGFGFTIYIKEIFFKKNK